uniref:MAK10-like protein n=1 Tax=Tanacetum cinerariifolium TaxID=118510 RepID=A0A6L2KUN9_TANCI|nr:MAK10-like protein [Tanacetum cinerariifolium]
MGDENPIRTLGDYSKPSHEGYRNTIELPIWNNVAPLRFDTIRLVQNGFSFHELRSEDLNQHLKDFLKLVDSLDLDGENRERTRLRLFQFSLRDQVSNWLERLPAGSISTWEDLTTRFLAEFFPPGPSPQPRALDTTFEARVRDYMAAHTERMKRFENTIFKQREEINGRMTEMFRLLKELTTSKTPEKVLIREEAKFPVTKNVNSISLTKGGEGGNNWKEATPDNTEKPTETETEMPETMDMKINEVENKAKPKPIKTPDDEEAAKAPDSQPVAYYLKHKINKELIKGLVNNNRFNNSWSRTQVVKKKGKEYKILPGVPAYKVILKKMITKKEDIGGNFKLPCSIGGLKHVHALINQGSDVNVMPYSTYMKLTNERLVETDIRLSLASHSYVYPLGIAEDMLVEVAEHIYHADFIIIDIKENKKRPFILGMPFLTTAKASIKFDTCTITLRSGKSKISLNRIPEPPSHVKKGIKNDIEPIAPTMTVNRLVLEWEERKRLHQEKEMEFNQWRSKNFKDERPAL